MGALPEVQACNGHKASDWVVFCLRQAGVLAGLHLCCSMPGTQEQPVLP